MILQFSVQWYTPAPLIQKNGCGGDPFPPRDWNGQASAWVVRIAPQRTFWNSSWMLLRFVSLSQYGSFSSKPTYNSTVYLRFSSSVTEGNSEFNRMLKRGKSFGLFGEEPLEVVGIPIATRIRSSYATRAHHSTSQQSKNLSL